MGSGYCGIWLILTGSLVSLLVSADNKPGCNITCFSNDTTCSFAYNPSTSVPAGTTCLWKLTRVNGTQTALTFSGVSLSGNDALLVYDGNENETNLVTTIRGKMDTFIGVMFKQNTTMVFQKKNNRTSKIEVFFNTTDCVLKFPPTYSAQVTSPVYLPARGTVKCEYILNGFTGVSEKVLDMSFTTFTVTDGSVNITGAKQAINLTGSNLPDDVISSTSLLTLQMTFANASKTSGFEGFYSVVDKQCSSTIKLNDTAMTLSLDMERDQYPVTDCRWLLTSPVGHTVTVNITRLDLALGADRLIVTDGGSLNSRVLAERVELTSGGVGDLIVSSGRSVVIRLVAGDLPEERHIKMTVMSTADGSHLYNNGSVSLKTQKTNRTSTKFYYQFSSPAGLQAQVVVDALSSNTLLYPAASISFYDGLQTTSPLLVKFTIPDVTQISSTTPFFPVTASGSSMLMVAENFNKKQNFTAVFSSILKGCNAIGSGLKGSYSLSSDVSSHECRWTIPARKNGVGNIVVSLQQASLLVNQTVTIYSGVLENGKPLRRFSRKSLQGLLPQISVPLSKGAELVFKSENGCTVNCTKPVVVADFTVNAKACGNPLLTSTRGRLSSPNYPNQYPLNSACTWRTKATPSNKTRLLYLSFASLRLAAGHKVEVVKVVNGTTNTLATFSGAVLPQDVLVARSNVSLRFSARPANQTETSAVDQGFSATYRLLDCGGRYTNVSANISSPRKQAGVCIWIINVPLTSKKGSLRNIVQFTITSSRDATGQLVFRDGASASAPVLPVKVAKGKSPTMMSRNNTLFVMYSPKPTSSVTFSIQYSTYSCNKTTQCDGGMCIHPDWRCDGVVQCADGKDELSCNGTSTKVYTGVKTFWVPLCLLIGVGLGVMFAIVIPVVYRRIKFPNYRELRDLTAPVNT